MDQYRKNYLQAQKKAAEIIMLKNNNYLGDVTSADITVRADISYVPNIRSWQRIDGYRAKESEEDTENCLKNAVYRWIRSSEGGSSVFIMDKVGGEIAVLYGSGSASNSAVGQGAMLHVLLFRQEMRKSGIRCAKMSL